MTRDVKKRETETIVLKSETKVISKELYLGFVKYR